MNENLPALTRLEAARLRDISRGEVEPYSIDLSPNHKRTSTNELIKLGYVSVHGRTTASTGRVMKVGICKITDMGRRWIAAFGAESKSS